MRQPDLPTETESKFNERLTSWFSVDSIIFGFSAQSLKVLLIQRDVYPFEGMWALPGDLVLPDEDLDLAAERVLQDLSGLSNIFMEQVHTFGKVGRHPQGRVITVAYYALVKQSAYQQLTPSSFARVAQWFDIKDLPELAFDHRDILDMAYDRLKTKLRYQPIGFEMLPRKFTLTQIQHLYETILGIELDTRNFRRKIQGMGFLIALDEKQKDVAHRAARLYKFDKKKYKELEAKGINFEI